jgi:transcriptional regulator with XRE-family HTH domain
MPRTFRSRPRTPSQGAADRNADQLARRAGKSLRDGRRGLRKTQQQIADLAGISRTRYAELEVNPGGGVTLASLSRAAMAVGGELRLYIAEHTAADQPRDAVHLRNQELIARTAASGGWRALPEEAIDREARTSRAADMLLQRGHEWCLQEVWDWFADVGAAFRDWDRRLAAVERLAIARMAPPPDPAPADTVPLPRVGGCWVVRATRRNRRLVAEHGHLFRARFPGSSRAWLAALTTQATMPTASALLWASVDGTRLFASRLG